MGSEPHRKYAQFEINIEDMLTLKLVTQTKVTFAIIFDQFFFIKNGLYLNFVKGCTIARYLSTEIAKVENMEPT